MVKTLPSGGDTSHPAAVRVTPENSIAIGGTSHLPRNPGMAGEQARRNPPPGASLALMKATVLSLFLVAGAGPARGDEVLFQEPFRGQLKEGWSWKRENPAGWRLAADALEIRIEPGNMWGPANDARNVLVRDLPAVDGPIEVSITVSNQPTEQYEQVDLTAYFDDSHMVKIGFELVDGKRCIVMGREEKDRTRTLAIVPLPPASAQVDLRLIIDGSTIRGAFRTTGATPWREAGRCELPGRSRPKLALQCYQGPAKAEHWARLSNLVVRRPGGASSP